MRLLARELIDEELNEHRDEVLYTTTLSDEEMDKEFSCGYGSVEGVPFTAWSENRVFFPVCYDGSEWVDSVPRNPCDEKTEHCGGG